MTSSIQRMAKLIRKRREQTGMSAAELARRADANKSTITRLEAGLIPNPRPETLKAVARALDLPASDLLASANYLDRDDVPSLMPYLRTRYGYMSDSAQKEIERSVRDIVARYGYDPDRHGPEAGEDEA